MPLNIMDLAVPTKDLPLELMALGKPYYSIDHIAIQDRGPHQAPSISDHDVYVVEVDVASPG